MPDWTPFFVLPNIRLSEALEFGVAALAPIDDPRVELIAQAHVSFGQFIQSFTDAFGSQRSPVVLLLRSDAKAFESFDALASLRDILSIAVVGKNRASILAGSANVHVVYSEAFAFYPWMLGTDYKHLVGCTPASRGIHDVSKFVGQSHPGFPSTRLDEYLLDQQLIQELLVRWRNMYEGTTPNQSDIALFRSLNMAYHASLMPEAISPSAYDIGRIISLWVSAFESLAHPGDGGQANLREVTKLIDRAPWFLPECRSQDHEIKVNKKELIKVTLASWMYEKIYRCRCKFLHGEPVTEEHLNLPNSKQSLFWCAAPVYRVALSAFLELTHSKDTSSMEEIEGRDGQALRLVIRMDDTNPQHEFEIALLTAIHPPRNAEE